MVIISKNHGDFSKRSTRSLDGVRKSQRLQNPPTSEIEHGVVRRSMRENKFQFPISKGMPENGSSSSRGFKQQNMEKSEKRDSTLKENSSLEVVSKRKQRLDVRLYKETFKPLKKTKLLESGPDEIEERLQEQSDGDESKLDRAKSIDGDMEGSNSGVKETVGVRKSRHSDDGGCLQVSKVDILPASCWPGIEAEENIRIQDLQANDSLRKKYPNQVIDLDDVGSSSSEDTHSCPLYGEPMSSSSCKMNILADECAKCLVDTRYTSHMDDSNDLQCDESTEHDGNFESDDDEEYNEETEDRTEMLCQVSVRKSLASNAPPLDNNALQSDHETQIVAQQCRTSKNLEMVMKKRKRRGPSKGLRVTGPMTLEYDKNGQPCGKWRRNYGKHVGICMRKLSILQSWKEVPEDMKKSMWDGTMVMFNIQHDEAKKKLFLSAVAKRFRDFKSKLVSGWIFKQRERTRKKTETIKEKERDSGKCAENEGVKEKKKDKYKDDRGEKQKETGREEEEEEEEEEERPQPEVLPFQIWSHIKPEEWELFVAKNTTPQQVAIREKQSRIAKKRKHHHRMGSQTFEAAREKWIAEGFYPTIKASTLASSSSTATPNIKADRVYDWWCSMHGVDQNGKRTISNPETQKIADAIIGLKQKEVTGEFSPEVNKDALYVMLGKDHRGRMRGVGGVCLGVRKVYGKEYSVATKSSSTAKSLHDLEAITMGIKEELREEMTETFNAILHQIGFSDSQLRSTLDRLRAGETDAPLSDPPMHELEEEAPCVLSLDVESDVFKEKPKGNKADSHAQGKKGLKEKEVDSPVGNTKVDVDYITKKVITRESLQEKLVNQKRLLSTRGSNPEPSTSQATAVLEPMLLKSLTKACFWLHACVSQLSNEVPIEVPVETSLFHYLEEAPTLIYKKDIKDFLCGETLNVSMIQVFMRQLYSDLCERDAIPNIGWLCPSMIQESNCLSNHADVKEYIDSSIKEALHTGEKFILAPYIEDLHWLLLVICPPSNTIYQFDSVRRVPPRNLLLKSLINSVLKRINGDGLHRSKVPIWKSVKCAQKEDGVECGYYVMRFMFDVVTSCTEAEDLEKVFFNTLREEPFTTEEINEVRDMLARYITDNCL